MNKGKLKITCFIHVCFNLSYMYTNKRCIYYMNTPVIKIVSSDCNFTLYFIDKSCSLEI